MYILFKYCRDQRPQLPIKGLKLWRFDNTISEIWAYVHGTCAETSISELPVKNLTAQFASATHISYKRCITFMSEYMLAMFWRFL